MTQTFIHLNNCAYKSVLSKLLDDVYFRKTVSLFQLLCFIFQTDKIMKQVIRI